MDSTYSQDMRREIDLILRDKLNALASGHDNLVALVERIAALEQQTINILQQIRDDRAQEKEDRKAITSFEARIQMLEISNARTDAGLIGPLKHVLGLTAGVGLTVAAGWLFGKH